MERVTTKKCTTCYRHSNCGLGVSLRDYCLGPYPSREEHIRAISKGIYSSEDKKKNNKQKEVEG